MRKSTAALLAAIGIALNFSGLLIHGLIHSWGFFIFHAVFLGLSIQVLLAILDSMEVPSDAKQDQ